MFNSKREPGLACISRLATTRSISSALDLADFSEHMLLGVGSKYGKNSNEYEIAGRFSERLTQH